MLHQDNFELLTLRSFQKLARCQHHNAKAFTVWMGVLQRLATTDWFTSRVSACGVFATAYSRAPQHLRADLRQLYSKLCRDDTPMVRRAAAFRLGRFAETMDPDTISKDIIPLFQDLTQDGKTAVKLL